jgi:nucleoid-associated protein YgaU
MEPKNKPPARPKGQPDKIKEDVDKGDPRFGPKPQLKKPATTKPTPQPKPRPVTKTVSTLTPAESPVGEAKPVAEAKPEPVVESPYLAEHTVAAGDNLSFISRKYYGTDAHWKAIYEENKETIGANPSMIRAGQVLRIPKK